MAENALTLKPLLTPAEQAPLGALPPLLPTLAKTGKPEWPREGPGSPTEPPLPPSSRSSADGRCGTCQLRYLSLRVLNERADCRFLRWVTLLAFVCMPRMPGACVCAAVRKGPQDQVMWLMVVIGVVQVFSLQLQERKGRQRVLPGFQRCPVGGLGLCRVQLPSAHALGQQVFHGWPVLQAEVHRGQTLS